MLSSDLSSFSITLVVVVDEGGGREIHELASSFFWSCWDISKV